MIDALECVVLDLGVLSHRNRDRADAGYLQALAANQHEMSQVAAALTITLLNEFLARRQPYSASMCLLLKDLMSHYDISTCQAVAAKVHEHSKAHTARFTLQCSKAFTLQCMLSS